VSERLAAELASLETMGAVKLRAEWRRVYRASPPRFTADLLARGIAHAIQTKALGGLDAKTERVLVALASRSDETPRPAAMVIKQGTRLVRSWGGKTHVVLVTEQGYAYEDKVHSSLSTIAKQITGAHWSRPRFFGLKPRSKAGRGG
jgi:Protein of unknown function (DUF2924)